MNTTSDQERRSLDADARLLTLHRECDTALRCLYIAVDERVADDVNAKVRAYIAAIRAEKQPTEKLRHGGENQNV